ncbi:hypothetical protein AAHA92_10788 [Salvia divinorum]|uniref:Uncharacterized protein n=1 Tax=Salvia divinorum TaxID=28513 RepID=A0ABD1HVT7_SALDI
MSAEETFLNLFDTYWFEQRPFAPSEKAAAPFPKVGAQESAAAAVEPKLNKITTLMRKSHSDHHLSSKDTSSEPSSPSPKSVLGPHLQTILSGKEVESFDETSAPQEFNKINTAGENEKIVDKVRRRRKRRGGASKSLSELEVEELKGFMDLGFVFSDEDKDSRLVSIIPGLMVREGEGMSETKASRPYLSEAWERMEEEERVVKNPMMGWRIPAFGNEMELKDHLRFWAHSVASTVR